MPRAAGDARHHAHLPPPQTPAHPRDRPAAATAAAPSATGANQAGPYAVDPAIQPPGESGEYRLANRPLAAEIELPRAIQPAAAQRRALPPGGAVPRGLCLRGRPAGAARRGSPQSFAPGKDMLVIDSFMSPRWSGDTRPGPAEGETARLPPPRHRAPRVPRSSTRSTALPRTLPRRISLAVAAKSDPAGIRPSHVNVAGGFCGSCLRGTTATIATTMRNHRRASRARSRRVDPRRRRVPAPVGDRADVAPGKKAEPAMST